MQNKNMRKYISIIGGVIIIVVAVLIAMKFVNNKDKKKNKSPKITKVVYTDIVENKTIPLIITTTGVLTAKNKIELFSEVQGILRISAKDFKSGTYYRRGETIISINSDEHYANLQSQKSNYYNILIAAMPDIKLDYPDEYEKWQTYLSIFDIEQTTPELPETNSDREKYFINSRNIYTNYYNVKNLEIRLNKYSIRAPYYGVLTEALVTPGTLIRQGQKIGEFLNPSVYEMEVSINTAYSHLLQKGNSVELQNLEHSQTWEGKVVRVNAKVDQATQTIKIYIQVKSNELREGMYLEASLVAKPVNDAFELPRKLLVNNNSLYVVKDSVLDLIKVNPVFFNEETVVVKGLRNGMQVLTKTVPGAYSGMSVKINKVGK